MVTLLLTLLGWSSVPLFLKHFAALIDPWTSNGWRYGFSALLWAPVLLHAARGRALPRRLWTLAFVPGVFNCLGQVCFTTAHYHIGPGLLTFGLRMQIIFVAAGAAMLFPTERRVVHSRGFLGGVALVLGGTIGVVLLGQADVTAGASGLGVGLAVASGLLFACYALAVRKFMHGIAPVTAFAAVSQYTAIGMVALMLAFGDRAGASVLDLAGMQIVWLLVSAVIGIALGHAFYYTAIARLGVAVSAGVIQLQPILVAVASYFLFGERLTAAQWACGAVAISGAGMILRTQQRAGARDMARSAGERVEARHTEA